MDQLFEGNNRIYNAAGALCTTTDELLALDWSSSCAILSKSCTKEFREGNAGKRYHEIVHSNSGEVIVMSSINSTGLANEGYQFYGEIAGSFNKPYIVSCAGLCLDDNLEMIQYLDKTDITAIEVNLSCPNIVGKPQIAYDMEATENYLRKIFDLGPEKEIGLKLSPYFDTSHFVKTAEIIEEFPVKFVTCCNSIGMGLYIDWEKEETVICPNRGHGGVGGTVMKPVSLANVRKFRDLLPDRIHVIGCGGVRTGTDVFEHFLCGASAVQVGSQLMNEGPIIFNRLQDELETVMLKKGYQNVEEFQGKLKVRES